MFGRGTDSNFATASNVSTTGTAQTSQRSVHPIRPLTIKQLLEAHSVGGGVMVVDGRETTQAMVIGRVVEYENASMAGAGALTAKHNGYRITDNTGIIVVRQWADASGAAEPLPLGSHVRASGSVKVWQGAPIITGTVTAIADSNEMNYHMLDAILTHLRLTQGSKRPANIKEAGGAPSVQNTASAVGVHNMLPGGDSKILLTDLLVSFIKQNGDTGLSMDELSASAQRYSFNGTDVRTAMRTLIAEGTVFQAHGGRFVV